MNDKKVLEVSMALPVLASLLSEYLEEKAGEIVPFTLVIGTNKVAQYVSNIKREESVELLEGLLARFKGKRADIPAHYNPDLKDLT